MSKLPEGWDIDGLWSHGDYIKSRDLDDRDFSNDEIANADAIIVAWTDPGDEENVEFITLHGADDYDSLYDLLDDIDADEYFG